MFGTIMPILTREAGRIARASVACRTLLCGVLALGSFGCGGGEESGALNAPAKPAVAAEEAPKPVDDAPFSVEGLGFHQICAEAAKALEAKDFPKTEKYYLAAMDMAAKNPEGWEYPYSIKVLGDFYVSQNDYVKGEDFYLKWVKAIEKQFGPDHANVSDALLMLTGVFNVQNKFEDSEPLFERALSIREKAKGPDDPTVAQVLEYQAGNWRRLGKEEEAAKADARAKAIRDKEPKK